MLNYDDISIPEAKEIQQKLRQQLDLQVINPQIQTLAGADISFNKFSTTVYAGVIVLSYPCLVPLYCSLAVAEVKFPYVPGFLAFREVPALLKAWEALPQKPNLLVVDGHGVAHPRRMGVAAHFGALSGESTIGCAKKLLFGNYQEPGLIKGEHTIIYDKYSEEQIGFALRTKTNVNPVFISPGHHIDFPTTLQLILRCTGKYRLPEPTRLAHETVNLFRTGKMKEGVHVFSAPLFI